MTNKELDTEMPHGTWLEYHYVLDGKHLDTYEEDISNKKLRLVLTEIMRIARISNFDYVYWNGLYHVDKKILGHAKLTKLAVLATK